MKLSEAFSTIKENFPDAIEVSHPEKIKQRGLYLYFDGVTPCDASTDYAHFILLLAGITLSTKGDGSIVAQLESIRKSVFMLGASAQDSYFKGIKAAVFEGDKLFMYAITLEIKIEV